MENFDTIYYKGFTVIHVNLTRATIKEAAELKELLEEAIILNHLNLVIDLSQCEFIDSTFLGALVIVSKKFSHRGGELILVRPSDIAKDLMDRARFDEIFNIYNTREEAVNIFV